MSAGHVPTTNLNTFYTNTTPGTTISSTKIDDAVGDIVATVNSNYDAAQPLDATLTALAAFNTNGLIKQTSADTFTAVTAPSGAVVGDTDTQTFTNKTLTAPKMTSGTSINDPNGNELIKFPATVASAVNEITVTNAATSGKPTISTTGGDTDITLNLVSKGAGTVQINAVDAVTTTGTQALTNKTITGTFTGNITGNADTVTTNANLTGDVTSVGNVTTIANTGVTASTYKSLTVNAKGQVTAGTNPTTLAAYGITDAAPLTHVGSNGTAQHAVATSGLAGFMSAADKTKLDGFTTGLVASYAIAADTYITYGGRFKQGYNSTTDSFDTIEY